MRPVILAAVSAAVAALLGAHTLTVLLVFGCVLVVAHTLEGIKP